jgi:hypothetical protein
VGKKRGKEAKKPEKETKEEEWLSGLEIDALHAEWLETVHNRWEEVDPDASYTWEGLALGWMLGSGIPLTQAHHLLLGDRWRY